MEKDVLNRILWDKNLKPEEFTICYIDRNKQKLSEIEFNRIELLGDFFRVGEKLIPLHRIRLIKRHGEIVWNRRRIDKV